MTPLNVVHGQGEIRLLASLAGTFPGSPTQLVYVVRLAGERIVSLRIRPPIELECLRALVTGGTKGIGRAVVNRLQRGGAQVLAVARSKPEDFPADLFAAADIASEAALCRRPVPRASGSAASTSSSTWRADRTRRPEVSRRRRTPTGSRRWS